MFRTPHILTLALVLASFAAPPGAMGYQDAARGKPPPLDDIAISPSRLELVMQPGAEKTVVVNLVYSSQTGAGDPTRVFAYLGDWGMTSEGKVEFFKPGTQPGSATPWLTYSPTEVVAEPARTHPIRVTISVPEDATPGDHLSVLFVEPRSDGIKLEGNRRQVRMKFRLAAVFYIMVPELTQKGSLTSLTARSGENGMTITPRLKNEGNSHLRPTFSLVVNDSVGALAAEISETESLPVLAGAETDLPIVIEKRLPPGSYSVRYRVGFCPGCPLTEGQTELVVTDHLASSRTDGPQAVKPRQDQ